MLVTVATFVPERKWRTLCARWEGLKSRLGRFSLDKIRRGMTLVGNPGARPDQAVFVAAARSEHHLQIFRDYLWRRSTPTDLIGREHVHEALAGGRGALIWVAHFSFNSLATKQAFHRAGFPVSHVSRPEHGFSKSRFGIAFLNPIRSRTELRYLKQRIEVDRAKPASSTRTALKLLAQNEIVSITAGAWEGGRVATVTIAGCQLDLATGAPGLAMASGAPLLPVITVRDEATGRIRVVVEEPIPVAADDDHDAALVAMAQEFADRVTPYVAAYPLQWRDWEKVRPKSKPG